MISKQEININKITQILTNIKEYVTNQSIASIFTQRVQERLDKALQQYYSELNKAFDKLAIYNDKHTEKLIRKINK